MTQKKADVSLWIYVPLGNDFLLISNCDFYIWRCLMEEEFVVEEI